MFYRQTSCNMNIPICWLSKSVLPPVLPTEVNCTIIYPVVQAGSLEFSFLVPLPTSPFPNKAIKSYRFLIHFMSRNYLVVFFFFFLNPIVSVQAATSLLTFGITLFSTFSSCQGLSKSWIPSLSHFILGSLLPLWWNSNFLAWQTGSFMIYL